MENSIKEYWMPHSHCVLDDPFVIAFSTIGNALTALAYALIPLTLLSILLTHWKQFYPNFKRLLVHSALFIALCGVTHVMDIWTWWYPDYNVAAGVTLACGTVSITFFIRLLVWSRTCHILKSGK